MDGRIGISLYEEQVDFILTSSKVFRLRCLFLSLLFLRLHLDMDPLVLERKKHPILGAPDETIRHSEWPGTENGAAKDIGDPSCHVPTPSTARRVPSILSIACRNLTSLILVPAT